VGRAVIGDAEGQITWRIGGIGSAVEPAIERPSTRVHGTDGGGTGGVLYFSGDSHVNPHPVPRVMRMSPIPLAYQPIRVDAVKGAGSNVSPVLVDDKNGIGAVEN